MIPRLFHRFEEARAIRFLSREGDFSMGKG